MPRLTPCTRHPRTKHTAWRTFEVCHEQLAPSRHTDTETDSQPHNGLMKKDDFKPELTGLSLKSIRLSTANVLSQKAQKNHAEENWELAFFPARDAQKLPRQSPFAPCVANAASTAACFLFQSSLRCKWEGRISQSCLADLIVRWVVLLGNLGTVSLEYVGTMPWILWF